MYPLKMQFMYSSDSKAVSSKTTHVSCLEMLIYTSTFLPYVFIDLFVRRAICCEIFYRELQN